MPIGAGGTSGLNCQASPPSPSGTTFGALSWNFRGMYSFHRCGGSRMCESAEMRGYSRAMRAALPREADRQPFVRFKRRPTMRATTLRVRTATPADVDDIFRLIGALASYEHLSTEVTGTRERLGEHLFGPRPYAEVLLAELAGRPIGFALFFYGYPTFRTAPCLYLE